MQSRLLNSSAAPSSVVARLIAKLAFYDQIAPEEEQALASVFATPIACSRGTILAQAGQELEHSTLLVSGFAHRFKDLADGRRQSLELCVPGDFVDLHAFTLKRVDHDIGCLSTCQVATASHAKLRQVAERYPHLGHLLWLNTTIDAALQRERIMSLGARIAVERLAHFVCETATRLKMVGLGSERGFDLPLTQSDLAEMLGLSPVHMNRTIRELRERRLAEISQRLVFIRDWSALAALAQFKPDYFGQRPSREGKASTPVKSFQYS